MKVKENLRKCAQMYEIKMKHVILNEILWDTWRELNGVSGLSIESNQG